MSSYAEIGNGVSIDMDEIILANHKFAPTKDLPLLVFERNVYSCMFFSNTMD